ncbi:MAG TPA: CBS domain-containing protein [Planctomycetota bacterium]|nr:CBS domain-containing protein [Planctomycetota bacterium]
MLVKDVMSTGVATCPVSRTLADAAKIMWDHDCGIVPIVEDGGEGKVIGTLTDRDACMAAYIKDRKLGDIAIADVIQQPVATCGPNDPVESALGVMRDRQIHRVPVVDKVGKLVGIITVKDVAAFAASSHATNGFREQVLQTLIKICQPRQRKETPAAQAAARVVGAPPATGAAPSNAPNPPQGGRSASAAS